MEPRLPRASCRSTYSGRHGQIHDEKRRISPAGVPGQAGIQQLGGMLESPEHALDLVRRSPREPGLVRKIAPRGARGQMMRAW